MRVHVEAIHAHSPARAAAAAVTEAFAVLAPRRELLVASVGWGDAPGVGVAPWTLAGLDAAAGEHGLQARHIRLAGCGGVDHPTPDASAGRVAVELPGTKRARRVPRRWFGLHLCLAVPCVHTRPAKRRSPAPWNGPVEQALRAIDSACDGPHARESATVGAQIASTIFASTTIVVDASWWAPMQADAGAPPTLLSLCRCVATGTAAPSAHWEEQVLRTVDPWLAAKLHLGPAHQGHDAVVPAGTAASTPWPRAPSKLDAPRGSLASEAVHALWKPRRTAGRRRLGPAVPGELGRLWHAFGADPL